MKKYRIKYEPAQGTTGWFYAVVYVRMGWFKWSYVGTYNTFDNATRRVKELADSRVYYYDRWGKQCL